MEILRKNTESHLGNDCQEAFLQCTNDDCKIEVKRKDYDNHVNKECEDRIVECPFKKFGCDVDGIKAKALKQHMDEYKIEHLSYKFDFVTSQVCIYSVLLNQNDNLYFMFDLI